MTSTLSTKKKDGHDVELRIVPEVTDQDEHPRQYQRLPLKGLDVSAQTAPPEQGDPKRAAPGLRRASES